MLALAYMLRQAIDAGKVKDRAQVAGHPFLSKV